MLRRGVGKLVLRAEESAPAKRMCLKRRRLTTRIKSSFLYSFFFSVKPYSYNFKRPLELLKKITIHTIRSEKRVFQLGA